MSAEDVRGELERLAGRCEQATGPDRELDALIVQALYPEAIIEPYVLGDDEPVVFHAEPLVRNKHILPAYTASLDAAMMLKPIGWRVAGLFERNCALPQWVWKAELWHPEADSDVRGIARNADVAALALTAACLRAAAALARSGE